MLNEAKERIPDSILTPQTLFCLAAPDSLCTASCRPLLQVVTQYGDREVPHVLEACERMEAHLTAAGKLLTTRLDRQAVDSWLAHPTGSGWMTACSALISFSPQGGLPVSQA